ncbi:MAG: hypothetical protein V2J07_12295 [Anaerolineae bacterium]|nr:hypothetical protein [Anaerolineae bacterium]
MFKSQRKIIISIFLAMLASMFAFSLVTSPVQASQPAEEIPVGPDGTGITIYFFWGEGCPHCEDEWEFFRSTLLPAYPGIVLKDFESWYNEDNADYYQQLAKAFGITAQYVPATFVGDFNVVGFSEEIGLQIQEQVENYIAQGSYPDPAARLEPDATAQETILSEAQIKLPLIGVVDLNNSSLLVSTILIAIVDGFNPCSLWVLTMLIALTLHSGSRKRVFVIGAVFLTVSTLIYALFIAGLFSVMSFMSYIGWVQGLVSVVALVFAVINIKDYFWYKEGVSLTIADDKKPGIFKRMRQIVNNSDNWWATILGTIVLAGGVSLIEFSCTAGLPVVWTNLLNAQGASVATFVLLLLVYMIIYQIDELIIFVPAVLTLKASKFEEKQGRMLKLLAGVVMLTISVVMLIDPEWMQDLGNTAIMFVIALGSTALILLLHRVILPKYGIRIGTELNVPKPRRVRRRDLR